MYIEKRSKRSNSIFQSVARFSIVFVDLSIHRSRATRFVTVTIVSCASDHLEVFFTCHTQGNTRLIDECEWRKEVEAFIPLLPCVLTRSIRGVCVCILVQCVTQRSEWFFFLHPIDAFIRRHTHTATPFSDWKNVF